MNTQIKLGLEGAFKVDLYSGSKFIESTDWFSNFITHTGLSYPSIYAFADCFRFLSIGRSSTPNYGYTAANTSGHTTGLADPIMFFLVNSSYGSQNGQYMDWRAYDAGENSPCGTVLNTEGPAFFRAWTIPSGDSSATMGELNGLTINEFMVSPSSGSDPSGKYAFSRVTRPLTIPFGYKAVVSYQLRIKVQNTGTGLGVSRIFSGDFKTGNADVTYDLDLVSGWNKLSGYYRQLYHGLACIDQNGATYIPKFGAVLEPSLRNLNECSFYLSPDNSSFDVNNLHGGPQEDESLAYSSDGIMKQYVYHGVSLTYQGPSNFSTMTNEEKKNYYLQLLPNRTRVADFPTVDIPTNIRMGMGLGGGGLLTPSIRNYAISNTEEIGTNFNYQEFQDALNEEISVATPGAIGLDPNKMNLGQKAVFSSKVYKLPVYNPTGRTKKQTRRTIFPPVSSLGTNTRFGSLVFAFMPEGQTVPQKVCYPLIDSLFFDSSGRSMMQHYRLISGIALTDRGTGVCDSYITIYQTQAGSGVQQPNIKRFYQRRTKQDGITGGAPLDVGGWLASNPDNALTIGAMNNTTGGDTSYGGGFGWGAVVGVSGADFTGFPLDCGLIDHSLNSLNKPTNGASLFWPNVSDVNNNLLQVIFTGIKFVKNGQVWNDPGPGVSGDVALASIGFSRPKGYIIHYENLANTGNRLLPNHGAPNNLDINKYQPTQGGYYPGLSLDNGLDLYLDIMWTADCGSALNCDPPGSTINWT